MVTVKLYRKIPVIIEAVQWDGFQESLYEIRRLGGKCKVTPLDNSELHIETLEDGKGSVQVAHIASLGDYIIRGVKGEIYPRKPDIFKATYEVVINQ